LNSEELYLLKIINDLTWHQYKEYGPEKTNSYELEEITGFDRVKIRLMLIKLRDKKLISNHDKFTGAKAGWFVTTKGNAVAQYRRYKKNENVL